MEQESRETTSAGGGEPVNRMLDGVDSSSSVEPDVENNNNALSAERNHVSTVPRGLCHDLIVHF